MKVRLPGIMIVFSTGKLGYIDPSGDVNKAEAARRFADEFATFLPTRDDYLALIDIYGIDLYTEKTDPAVSRERFCNKLAGLTLVAKRHGKIAAISEAGNRGLLPRRTAASKPSKGSILISNPGSKIPTSMWPMP